MLSSASGRQGEVCLFLFFLIPGGRGSIRARCILTSALWLQDWSMCVAHLV